MSIEEKVEKFLSTVDPESFFNGAKREPLPQDDLKWQWITTELDHSFDDDPSIYTIYQFSDPANKEQTYVMFSGYRPSAHFANDIYEQWLFVEKQEKVIRVWEPKQK